MYVGWFCLNINFIIRDSNFEYYISYLESVVVVAVVEVVVVVVLEVRVVVVVAVRVVAVVIKGTFIKSSIFGTLHSS